MPQFQTVNVGGNQSVMLVDSTDQQPALLFNSDTVNTVWISDADNRAAGDAYSTPIAPQGYAVADGSTDIYAIAGAVGETIAVYVMPGISSFFQTTNLVVNKITIEGAGEYLIGYSPTAGANNLVFSDSPVAFVDQYGNSVLAGRSAYHYDGTKYLAISLLAGAATGTGLVWYYGNPNQTAWVAGPTLSADDNGNLYITPNGTPGAIFTSGAFLALPVPLVEPTSAELGLGSALYDWNGWPRAIDFYGNIMSAGEWVGSPVDNGGAQTFSSTGFVPINGLEYTMEAGKNYLVEGVIDVSPAGAAGAGKLEFAGTATITAMRIQVEELVNGSPGSVGNCLILSALASAFTSTTFTTPGRKWKFYGTVQCLTTGTFVAEGACTVAADHWSTSNNGTYMRIIPQISTD